MDLLTITVELAFTVLFVTALSSAIRTRDPLARDVSLVFAPLAFLLVVAVLAAILGQAPAVLRAGSVVLLLAEPLFVLHLVADLRPIPRWLGPASVLAVAATAGPVAALGAAASSAAVVGAVVAFVAVETIAAAYLVLEAARRRGAARIRLATAAFATGALAAAILVLGAGEVGVPESLTGEIAKLAALAAALGYLVAFLPPVRLRRIWHANAAYAYTQALAATPAAASAESLWHRLTDAAADIAGGAAFVGPTDDGRSAVISASGLAAGIDASGLAAGIDRPTLPPHPAAELERLADSGPGEPAGSESAIVAELRARTASRVASVVAVRFGGDLAGVLVILARSPSLFGADDDELIRALTTQTAALVERRAILAEQERLSQRLGATVQALEAASAAKSDFLASMSHELRTPLNAIIGFSELMAGEPAADGRLDVPAEWVDHVRRSGQHLLGLINDVLDLAKVEAGRLELVPEPIDVGTAITESLAGLRPLADRKGLGLAAHVEPVTIAGDRGRFRQILYNLLSNAIKYTPDGGRVSVEARRTPDGVEIAVVDTGVGIAEADQAHVFEEFRQVGDPALRQAGTGLGLALTRRLVEAHGGTIEVASTLGAGSRFTVHLPGSEPNAVPRSARPAARPADADAEAVGRDVLVVEDDPGAARLLRAYLEDEGYRVRVATDGESGLAEARRERPAAILLDVLLPGLDGWDVLRLLKADQRVRDVPVVIVTVVDERDVGLALGASDYFLKPVDRDALVACVNRLTRVSGPGRQTSAAPRVMVVDDEPASLALVEAALVPAGIDVVPVGSGGEAVALAFEQRVDLVICDLVMPGMSGFDVVATLRADDRTRGLPILILTSHELSPTDKARLNGQVLGIVEKGRTGVDGLLAWLAAMAPPTGPRRAARTGAA